MRLDVPLSRDWEKKRCRPVATSTAPLSATIGDSSSMSSAVPDSQWVDHAGLPDQLVLVMSAMSCSS